VGRIGRSVPVLLQFADPDVAVAHRIAVILQRRQELFGPGRRVSLASAAFALTGSPRGFFQPNTLVAVIGHAQVGALVIRELESDGLN
jgi:hypothetical protein